VALRPNGPATLIETLPGGNRQKVVIVHRFFGPVRLPANCRSNNSAALSPALRSFSLRAGQRATALTSLIHCAQLNGHDPYVYLKPSSGAYRQTFPAPNKKGRFDRNRNGLVILAGVAA
jgi:hypothetical protein